MSGLLRKIRHSRPVGIARYHFYRDVLLAWPRRRSCNICGWAGRRFLSYDRYRFVLCPQCGSLDRHRLIAALFQHDARFVRDAGVDRCVLHVSPEYCLRLLLEGRARGYVRADWATDDCDVRQDMTRMAFQSGVFDTIVCCDTLEHIHDDAAALAECHRLLKPGGVAILTVPQSDEYATREDPSIRTDDERRRVFGQHDHVRNYGADFADRIAAAGFRLTCVEAGSFDPALVAAHVLAPPIALHVPWGWNRRRIYVAERA